MSTVGYRVGEPAEHRAFKVLAFEIFEDGNGPMLYYVAMALRCRMQWCEILKTLGRRFQGQPKAVWLCRTKAAARKLYGHGTAEPDKIRVPPDALMICDLDYDGQLYVYTGDLEYL